ncbi:energy transducer TonB [Helicobacter sp. MIT 05-5293]|uniref:TonB family protein n=1 Tax=Helicobacter sp. MIT 05-5293 TaxID=1548149 RepID=UPI00051D4708|nr:TonB family protein [Helicobacter sp. MIT 05-5293]TLD80592.1 energy transducer TonB [Helicobacter sp. MIT 05-5293]
MKNLQEENNSRLFVCLIFSLIAHFLVLSILFFQINQLQFKKGTSLDPKMKVAGFQIIGNDDIFSPPSQSSNSSQASSSQTIPTLQDSSQPHSESPLQTPETPRSIDLNSLSLYDGKHTNKNKQDTPNPNPSHIKALAKFPKVDSTTRRDIEELYGEEFGDYGLAEQEFLINNLRDIGRITQRYLQYPPSAIRLGQEGLSAVEFFLYPNGDISDLKIIVSSNYMLLDRNSERTIEIAYKDYPHPTTKTRIRIFVNYGIYYYGY